MILYNKNELGNRKFEKIYKNNNIIKTVNFGKPILSKLYFIIT